MREVTEIFIHTEELNNDPPASLAQSAFCPWPSSMYNALGRINTLEFYIRHAQVCYSIPHRH